MIKIIKKMTHLFIVSFLMINNALSMGLGLNPENYSLLPEEYFTIDEDDELFVQEIDEEEQEVPYVLEDRTTETIIIEEEPLVIRHGEE